MARARKCAIASTRDQVSKLLGWRLMHTAGCVVLLATGCAYQAGSFQYGLQTFDGLHVRAGCLDLAIDRRPDLEQAPVVAYTFGNRCEVPALIDLASAYVVARSDVADVALLPFDPRHELGARELDARAVGHEAIAYRAVQPAATVCVDAATVVRIPGPSWTCFEEPQLAEEP